MKTLLTLSTVVLLPAGSAGAAVIPVPSVEATIQAGIDAAEPGDVVVVAPGIYTGFGNRNLNFRGKAITLRSELGATGAATTVIDCERTGRGFNFENDEGPDAVVIGLTVKNGDFDLGGAVCCLGGSSPTFRDCVFTQCAASDNGGGVYCGFGSAVVLERCVISGNSAFLGGGIFCEGSSPKVVDCVVSRNLGSSGGGLHCRTGSAPVVSGTSFESNKSTHGGGIYLDGVSPKFTGCSVIGNDASSGGGCFFLNSSPTLAACRVVGNRAGQTAGGLCFIGGSSPVLTNCLILGNLAGQGGAFASENETDLPALLNCTISANRATFLGGGINCHLKARPRLGNCIVWDNAVLAPGEPDGEAVCGEVNCCLTENDPLFIRPGAFDTTRTVEVQFLGRQASMPDFVLDPGDYSLSGNSPAVDAGCAEDPPPVDFTGRSRECGPGIDLGAYEFCQTELPPFRRGDANADGLHDLSDAAFILSFLFLGGPAPACLKTADVDDHGLLDLADPVLLLMHLFLDETLRPPAPYPSCGPDPTSDSLTCLSSCN